MEAEKGVTGGGGGGWRQKWGAGGCCVGDTMSRDR